MRTVRTPTLDDVVVAGDIIERHLAPTPVVSSAGLGTDVLLKLETLQPTGSFKVRGALVAVHHASARDAATRIVTASAGNHGLGVAYAATVYGAPATVVVPENASAAKRAALTRYDIELLAVGSSYDEAEAHALQLTESNAVFVSPYNDPDTIAGQGTIVRELLAHAPGVQTIVVPIGGGGLISGIGLAAAAHEGIRVVGVEAAASPAVLTALRDGSTITVQPTLADGLAGNLEPGSITVELCRRYVDHIVDVTESEIADGMRFLFEQHGLVVEGSGAVGVAALLHGHVRADEGTTAVLLTGRNVTPETFARVLTTPAGA